jgi:hypothetical protein
MKIENVEVYGFRRSLHGMRNPKNSWDKSDSTFYGNTTNGIYCIECPKIGPEDMKLCKRLIKNGTDHRKFMRQIQIWMDITIPRYAWQELDTYKVATVRNSCSTMHKLGHTSLSYKDFQDGDVLSVTLDELNDAGEAYRDKKPFITLKGKKLEGYDIVRYMKKIIPESFLQKATYTMSYETAMSMYFARRNHRLPEWNEDNPESICAMFISLPYMKEFTEV